MIGGGPGVARLPQRVTSEGTHGGGSSGLVERSRVLAALVRQDRGLRRLKWCDKPEPQTADSQRFWSPSAG